MRAIAGFFQGWNLVIATFIGFAAFMISTLLVRILTRFVGSRANLAAA